MRGVNLYSPEPGDPSVRPWHRVPSSASPLVALWDLPLPTDMSPATEPLVARAVYVRALMERSRGDIRQWSWVWEQEIERVQFVSSATMEDNYARKAEEIGPEFQVVFHGTEERSNVASILRRGFDRAHVKRVRRGLSPAWCSSSFDKAFSFSRKPGAVLMNRLLLGATWRDSSRRDIRPPWDTKLCTADSMFPSGHSSLPHPHYPQMGCQVGRTTATGQVYWATTQFIDTGWRPHRFPFFWE